MSDVCAQTWFVAKYCYRHSVTYWRTCPRCLQEAAQRPEVADVTTLRLNVQSGTIDLLMELQLESHRDYAELRERLADLEIEIGALRRRVTELEHGRIAGQAAHNALVEQVEELALTVLNLKDRIP